ncbi:MAG: hypothetical protein Q7S09_05610 [bacterium]|nr:hypothetical protein [bacterium]
MEHKIIPETRKPNYGEDRAASQGEIRTAEILEAQERQRLETDRMVSSNAIVEAALAVEDWWRKYIRSPDFQRALDDGSLKARIVRGGDREFEEAEIRDAEGKILFYYNKKGLEAVMSRTYTGREKN